MYHISPDVVASALKIPRVAKPGYPYIGQLVPLRDSMMELFCGKTIAWGTKKQIPPLSSHVRLVSLIWLCPTICCLFLIGTHSGFAELSFYMPL